MAIIKAGAVLRGVQGGLPGHVAVCAFNDVSTFLAVDALLSLLQTVSNGTIPEYFNLAREWMPEPLPPIAGTNVDKMCVVLLKDVNSGSTVRFSIPAIKDEYTFEDSEGVKPTQALLDLVQAFSGQHGNRDLIVIRGWIKQVE